MNESKVVISSLIESKIYLIRNTYVMFDRDLADFYEVKPTRLRQQVKRNVNRFPEDFMFQLTQSEIDFLVSKDVIPSRQYFGGALPFVFTEPGVAAISSVLTSEKAVEVSILIMRAFVHLRRFIAINAEVFQRLDHVEFRQLQSEKKFEQVFKLLGDKTMQPKQGIFYDGQVFDAYEFISKLIRSAKKSIILIDNYVDDSVLTHLSKKKKTVEVIIYTKSISKQLALDIKKFQEQYPPVKVISFKEAHDRFLIIDHKTIYHIGASLKDLGKKWFAFSKMEVKALEMLKRLPDAA